MSGARARQGGALLAVLAIAGCGRVGYDADAASTMDAHALDATGLDAPSLEVGALDASLDAPPIDAPPIDASLDAREASVDMRDATSVDGGDDIVCGDGIVEAFEVCDDANASAGDGCAACLPSPGFLCVGEPSRCTSRCGDGVLAPSEQCDDGDLDPGDGCAAGCTIEAGFACNRGQAPYFAFRQGRTDCVETTSASLADGTLFFIEDATVRLRHVGGAYRYGGARWVAVARVTAYLDDGAGATLEGPTFLAPPGTRTPDDEVSRAAAIDYAARAGARDLTATDVRTVALSLWDSACGDNTDEMTVWRVDRLSQCVPTPSGLVSWLPLDNSFLDAIAGRPALSPPVSHAFGEGVRGWHLSLSAPTALDTSALGSPDYTLAFWFGWADRSTPPPRMQDVVSVAGASVEARLDTSSTFTLLTRWDALVSASGLDVALPHHVAIAVTASPRTAEIYVDGVRIDTITSTAIPSPLGPMLRLYAGEEIDELRLYDRPLPAPEIAALATR